MDPDLVDALAAAVEVFAMVDENEWANLVAEEVKAGSGMMPASAMVLEGRGQAGHLPVEPGDHRTSVASAGIEGGPLLTSNPANVALAP